MTPKSECRQRPVQPHGKRLLILLLSGAMLIGCGALCRRYCLRSPLGSGPAGPVVPRSAFARVWTERKVLLLGLGDSITAGYGASPGHSFFDRLARNPDDEFPGMKGICLATVLPNLTPRNLAQSGTTSLEHMAWQIKRFKRYPADTLGVVVMTTGGNDIIHTYGRAAPREGGMYGATMAQAGPWIAAFEKRLDAMMTLIEQAFPGGCHIFLGDIYDPTDGVGDIERAGLPKWKDGLEILHTYNHAIARCAAQRANVHLVKIHDAFLGHGLHCAQFWRDTYRPEDPHYWYYHNLEDPNDRGYDAIRRLYLLEMIKVLQ